MEATEPETTGFQQTLKDLFAGAAGGIAQVLSGGFADDVDERGPVFRHNPFL